MVKILCNNNDNNCNTTTNNNDNDNDNNNNNNRARRLVQTNRRSHKPTQKQISPSRSLTLSVPNPSVRRLIVSTASDTSLNLPLSKRRHTCHVHGGMPRRGGALRPSSLRF